jgi:signal transduction histidine kinase
MALSQFGFGNARQEGEELRTYALPSRDGRMVVQVAESVDDRAQQLGAVTVRYVAFLLLPFGLIMAGTWLLLRRSLRSIDSIARQLRNRNPLDASALEVDRPPEEMLPIVSSLDAMFGRIRHALSVERRFTSVAAHELRTPLAGLRAHAQLAMRATSADESKESLQAVLQGVDRASHLLTQLLDIAKIEALAEESAPRLQLVDLKQIYFDALKDLMPEANKKGVVVTEDLRVSEVQGLPFGIFLMLRNLLANALLYCPPGGAVRFETFIEGGRAALTVDDSGPGIAAEDRERAFERFNRLGQHETRGVGLGLSIVLMVVELHGAKVSLLDSPLGGLRCRVVFGASAPEAGKFLPSSLATA